MISGYAASFGSLQDHTSPYRWLKQRFGGANLVNIHGTLDGESIFGIDGFGNLDDRDILPYYYGSSLGIAGRSNNRAHKLMLEGRLVVREI